MIEGICCSHTLFGHALCRSSYLTCVARFVASVSGTLTVHRSRRGAHLGLRRMAPSRGPAVMGEEQRWRPVWTASNFDPAWRASVRSPPCSRKLPPKVINTYGQRHLVFDQLMDPFSSLDVSS